MAVNDQRAAEEPPSSGRERRSVAAAELCTSITPGTRMVPLWLWELQQLKLAMLPKPPAIQWPEGFSLSADRA